MYKNVIKRLLDIVISGCAIIVLAIPMGVVAVMIKLDTPGPVLFKQKRVGKNKKHFMIWKFRSMPTTVPKDTPTHQLQNASSLLTPFEEKLRASSLDELPQLFNIFAGKMSFVGPRPALWNQYDLIEERDKYGANDVLPGLTGWAQINGRDELPIDVKARFDGEYVEKLSFGFDLKCFFGTFSKVLSHEGVVEGAVVKDTTTDAGIDDNATVDNDTAQ